MELSKIDVYAKSIILQAGDRIRQSFSEKWTIETKADANDLVTNIDREIELFFIEKIRTFNSSHKIIGEEGMGEKIQSLDGVVWIIDPIDGTMNFVRQHRNFAISVGIYVDGIGKLGYIYDVMRDHLYHAIEGQGAYMNDQPLKALEEISLDKAIIGLNAVWATPNKRIKHEPMIELVHKVRGTRSYGSAALEIVSVASGRMDAYLSMRLSPWDIAGGVMIANEVGAIASNLENQPINLLERDTFIIANPFIHKEIVENYIELK
ncbi:inositol monophosphatase family protein [Rummeliibacillus sp. G93]|uniref:inositol monophosphatase family protein n=1 Tax=Rummeliibacillus TaxID=648802 RepID=UPI00116AA937|nr:MULTISPECIES: inositol monophosphatase family protein [Rummeliibacillus]MBB5170013.1 myo-inositol-1(or 4)-monophosphatase [Rummeliibacillus stabekisii]UQW98257.1 inositol monophosphatase family protein [Rummeliibacillus sp. G93]GEL04271.1 inositol-1-monophosphatase [Rummeliibacillus stabekisii]